jgi:predicted RNase H-like HicB family nuclease
MLNVEVSSFGETIDEAVSNLKEAVELYFEDENLGFSEIDAVFVGKEKVHT